MMRAPIIYQSARIIGNLMMRTCSGNALPRSNTTLITSLFQIARWFEPMIDSMAMLQTEQSPRDVSEIIITSVIGVTQRFGPPALASVLIANSIFDNRHFAMGLEVAMIKLKDVVDVPRRELWLAAWPLHQQTESDDQNAIMRNHPSLPFNSDVNIIEPIIHKLVGSKQPAIPSIAFDKASLISTTQRFNVVRSTTYPYRAITKDWNRSAGGSVLATGMLLEYYIIGEYREALLKGQGGILRHKIYDALEGILPSSMIIKEHGVKYMRFYDGFYFPCVKLDPGKSFTNIINAAALERALIDELAAFTKHFNRLKCIQLMTGRYRVGEGPYVERIISGKFDDLRDVSPQLRILHLSLY